MLKPSAQDTKRGTFQACQICCKKFNPLTCKQHQCKRCLSAICSSCGSTRYPVYDSALQSELHRVCSRCKLDIEWLHLIKSELRISFATNTTLSAKILKAALRKSEEAVAKEYVKASSLSNQESAKLKGAVARLKAELVPSLNNSTKELLAISLCGRPLQSIFQPVRNVAYALLNSVRGLQFQPEIFHLVTFMLIFADQASAFGILQKYYSLATPFLSSRKPAIFSEVAQTLLERAQGLDSGDKQRVKACFQTLAYPSLVACTANILPASSTLLILTSTVSKGQLEELFKGVFSGLEQVREQLRRKQPLGQALLRKVEKNKLKARMEKLVCSLSKYREESEEKETVQPTESAVESHRSNTLVLDSRPREQKQSCDKHKVVIDSLRRKLVICEEQLQLAIKDRETIGTLTEQLQQKEQKIKELELRASQADERVIVGLEERVARLEGESWKLSKVGQQIKSLVNSFSRIAGDNQDQKSKQLYEALLHIDRCCDQKAEVPAEEESLARRNRTLCERLGIAFGLVEQRERTVKKLHSALEAESERAAGLQTKLASLREEHESLRKKLHKFQNFELRHEQLIDVSEFNEVFLQLQQVEDVSVRYSLTEFFKKSRLISEDLRYSYVESCVKRERLLLLQARLEEAFAQNLRLRDKLLAQAESRMAQIDAQAESINDQVFKDLRVTCDAPEPDRCRQY